MPAVSIIVPVYNVEPYLRRCIDSILAQTFSDFECILVDDCSPDNCPAICDEYAKKDNRIKVIHKAQNEGLPFARKTGLENSSGKYIQHIDSDDYIEPDMIECLYHYAISGNYDMVCFDYYKYTKSNKIIYRNMSPVSDDYIKNIKNIAFEFIYKASLCNKLIKREVYQNIEFPKDNYHEDTYLSTQALFYSKNIGYINRAFYHYIYNSNSIRHHRKITWKSYLKRYIEASNNYGKIIDFLKKKYGDDLSAFEPELSIRMKQIKGMDPRIPKNIIKKAFRIIFTNF